LTPIVIDEEKNIFIIFDTLIQCKKKHFSLSLMKRPNNLVLSLQPSLIFASKASAYPNGAPLGACYWLLSLTADIGQAGRPYQGQF
jgi:hypothetical protein